VINFRGIDVRETSARLVFRAFLQDSAGALMTTPATTLKLYELQNDGTLKSYDFNDNTFKTGALTTETLAMTHRQGNNSTTNTGLWSVALTTLTGFSVGSIYFAMVNNSGASPTDQQREFQFGSRGGSFETIIEATVSDAGASTTVFDTSLTEATANHHAGRVLVFTTGALAGQATTITSSQIDGGKTEFTVPELTEAPTNGDAFVIF